MDKYIGKVLSDRYELTELIGVGGMAVVYKAVDRLIGRVVAIKILKEEFGQNTQFRRRFSNESRVISLLSHANIVDVYDVNLEGELQYIVMEYVDGITFKEFISRKGSLQCDEIIFFAEQILSALAHAHERGIIHRDIKPHNIMMLPDKTLKVADFGIARATKFDTVTMTDKTIGSVHYISPEQASGSKTDEKSDLYSVGIMLYEMATGVLPFEGDTPVTVALMQVQAHPKFPTGIKEDIPKGLEEIILKAMAKDPENRYSSATEMLTDLRALKADNTITFGYKYNMDQSPTRKIDGISDLLATGETKKKQSNLKPILLGVITAFVLFLVALSVLFYVGNNSTSNLVEVPDFVGLDYNTTVNNPEYSNKFTIVQGKQEFSDKYEDGIIISQSIEKGSKMSKGTVITVDISKGISTTAVPEVDGFEYAQAVSILQTAKFTTAQPKYEPSDSVPQGTVIKTVPAGGENVASGSTVTVYVSSGAHVEKVTVPGVMGAYEKEAIDNITEAGLVPVVEYREDDDSNEIGRVVKQMPISGNQVDRGSKVTITVTMRSSGF